MHSRAVAFLQMGSNRLKIKLKLKRCENKLTDSSFYGQGDNTNQKPIFIPSSSSSSSSSSDDESKKNKQLVLYDPAANGTIAFEPYPDPIQFQSPQYPTYSTPYRPSRILPSVGAFTVQCANCFKWRLIPTKEKYEEIREHILDCPFYCETARQWRPDVSCDDPPDICQDDSKLWAIDKPNIAQPPAGWQRLLRIRAEGSSKFADVYYVAPSGKVLRSMVEIHRYLLEHPEFTRDGITMSQFSFQIPKPLQENYVRKRRPTRLTVSSDGSRAIEPNEVRHLTWNHADDVPDSQHLSPGSDLLSIEAPLTNLVHRPAKRLATGIPLKEMYSSTSNIGTEPS